MSDEESYEYEYDDDDMDEGGFEYTDDEEQANDSEVALGMECTQRLVKNSAIFSLKKIK